MDRMIHHNDYTELNNTLHNLRSNRDLIKDKIKQLEMEYSKYKNSDKGPQLEIELKNNNEKLQEIELKLNHYKKLGRKGLYISPIDQLQNEAKNSGRIQGAIGGSILGIGLGGMAQHYLNQ